MQTQVTAVGKAQKAKEKRRKEYEKLKAEFG